MTKEEVVVKLNECYNAVAVMDYEPEFNAALAKMGEAILLLGGKIADPPAEEPKSKKKKK